MKPVRLFVAVDPTAEVRESLGAALARVRSCARFASWVDAASFHVTLSFLGGTDPARVPELTAALSAVASRHAPLELRFTGAGAFGGRRPRVLWAGIQGEVAALAALQRDVAAALAPLGFPPEERPFSAHITLARAREHRGEPGFDDCARALASEDFGTSRVETVVLYRSDPGQRGAVYTPVATFPLDASRSTAE